MDARSIMGDSFIMQLVSVNSADMDELRFKRITLYKLHHYFFSLLNSVSNASLSKIALLSDYERL